MIDLNLGPHLFLDAARVAACHNIARHLQQPVRHPDPVLISEHPWEAAMVQVYGNALVEDGRFRLWYHTAEKRDPLDVPWDVPQTSRPQNIYNACLAESEDGLRWTKPMVTPIDVPPYTRHNVLINDMHSICVLRDNADEDPARRYKALGGDKTAVSPDGVHWQVRTNKAVGKNDTGSSLVSWRGEYLAFVRQQTSVPDWPVVRAVGLSTSRDFDTWEPKITVFETDATDGHPFAQPYGLSVFPCGDLLVGILYTIILDREPEQVHAWKWNNRVGDYRVELVCSRDGRQWSRVADRAAFMTPTPGAWDSARVWPGTSVLVHDDALWIYFTGTTARHGQGSGPSAAIGLATLPADRLLALTPERRDREAWLTTLPLSGTGNKGKDLLINAEIAHGDAVRVAVVADAGRIVDGLGASDCVLTRHDARRWRVRWGTRRLSAVPEGSALQISLRGKARLFSLQSSDG